MKHDFEKFHNLFLKLNFNFMYADRKNYSSVAERQHKINTVRALTAFVYSSPFFAVIDCFCQTHQICSTVYIWQCVGSWKVG